ncbi:MAG TPA: peptide ABC transporter ATP-binding protein, partial [Candidatus Krumholzibacteria bacterium]|nr:peptide ABC transporter ATP-binding protein [Candidatus Krumholzibacteria bacterium]
MTEPRPAHEPASGENGALLRVENLSKYYPIRRGVLSRVVGHVKDVDGVSFEVKRGET